MKLLYPGDSKEVQDSLIQLSYEEIVERSGVKFPNSNWSNIKLYQHSWQGFTYDSPPLYGLDQVEFNPTDLCNRKCWMCPRADENIWPNNNTHLSQETHAKVVDDLNRHKYSNVIMWSGWGEPLLNPNILDMMRYTRDNLPMARQHLITNGDRLVKEQGLLDMLIDAGMKNVMIDVYDGDEHLIKVLKMIKESKLKENINLTVSRKYRTPDNYYGTRNGTMDPYQKVNQMWRNKKTNPCFVLMSYAFINFDGNLIYCCHDWSIKNGKLADLSVELLSDVWTNPQIRDVRKELSVDRKNVSGCANCDALGMNTSYGHRKAELFKVKNLI